MLLSYQAYADLLPLLIDSLCCFWEGLAADLALHWATWLYIRVGRNSWDSLHHSLLTEGHHTLTELELAAGMLVFAPRQHEKSSMLMPVSLMLAHHTSCSVRTDRVMWSCHLPFIGRGKPHSGHIPPRGGQLVGVWEDTWADVGDGGLHVLQGSAVGALHNAARIQPTAMTQAARLTRME